MTDIGSLECMVFTISDGIAEVQFTRPDLLNRFDRPAHGEFEALVHHVAKLGDTVRVLVISAQGRAFSAGGDFKEMQAAHYSEEVREQMRREARSIVNGLIGLPIPVIAAVQGAAIGLGATLATLADIVVAWRDAKIADTHAKIGLVAGDGGIIGWTQSMGVNIAKYYLLTGDVLTGAEAFQRGMVARVVDSPDEVRPAALAIAQKLKGFPPEGLTGTKKAFTPITRAIAEKVLELGLDLEVDSMKSKAHLDLINAMMTKS